MTTRDLPTGTVTFLFTDIEGSTRLLERLGQDYHDVQERHDAIVRAAISEGGGREVGTEGDAFFAVFLSPIGAVRAAAEVQRGLAATALPERPAVRVRIGLHTGEGILGGANYLGLDVNRAARIAAAGHGGQVLLSNATRALIERRLPPGTQLRDLGAHRLKDLAQPERLYELVIEGLEKNFPPPRTLDARPNNLPAQLTRFIGRHDEIARVRELLAGNRLVTLTGTGGTGKTRLALQVAAEALGSFGDGVFFVDLSAVTDSDVVAEAIAGVLGVREEPGQEMSDTLGQYLREKELLLVLDNFEQVIDAGPSDLVPLLKAAPGAKALVTSRVPLHLTGESEFHVPPLALPDRETIAAPDALAKFEAVALFVERAAARNPTFRITADNARSIAEITARLDGLPLAIELAASRVKMLSPEMLLARLGRRLPLLSAQDRNVPERQRTLRRTIDWSHGLLDQAERRMFSRLAVFAGGADMEAVEAVANPEGDLGLDTLDGLAALVDTNLVRSAEVSEGEPRFTMLETIREYGLERLSASGEEAAIRRRHAKHLIAVVERTTLFGGEQGASILRLEREHDNFRAALRWSIQSGEADLGLRLGAALRDFWRLGSHQEGARWLDELLALPGAAARTALRARALTAAADLSSWMRATGSYLSRAQEAVAIYRELDDPGGIPDALEELGVAQMSVGHLEAARASLLEARELNVRLGNRQKASESTMALGMLAFLGNDIDHAREGFEEALATFRDLGDPFWIAFSERMLGAVERVNGNLEAAETHYRASLSAAQQHGILGITASVLYGFADLAVARGSHERALRLVGAADVIRERVGEAPSLEMAMMGDVRQAARSLMDETSAESFYREGRALQLDSAVTYALQPDGD